MKATLAQVKAKVIRLLNDEVIISDYGVSGGTTYGADLLNDAIRAALDAISSQCWQMKTFDIVVTGSNQPDETGQLPNYSGLGANNISDLPTDLLEILTVFDNNSDVGVFLPKLRLVPGAKMIDYSFQNSWFYLNGTLSFGSDLGDKGAKIYYIASWDLPDDETDTLEPPDNTLGAIVFYACSYCLLQQAAGISTIRQYNTRVDSGQPTDNPTNEMSNFFLRRFDIEMSRLPLMTKEVNA